MTEQEIIEIINREMRYNQEAYIRKKNKLYKKITNGSYNGAIQDILNLTKLKAESDGLAALLRNIGVKNYRICNIKD